MANVVREDVVQISFDINNSVLTEADNLANSLTDNATRGMAQIDTGIANVNNSASGLNTTLANSSTVASGLGDSMHGMASAADEIGRGAYTAASGFDTVANEVTAASRVVDIIRNNISQFDTGVSTAKSGVTEFVAKLKEIASAGLDKIIHPIQTIKTALGSAKEQAAQFVTRLKDIGKTGIDKVERGIDSLTTKFTEARLQASIMAGAVKTSLGQIKGALTQGKTGVSGFTTALKNVGKISVVGTVNGIKGLANGIKSIGKMSFKGVTAGIKGIAASAKAALPSLQKFAKQKFEQLISGLGKVGSKLKEIGSKALDAAGKLAKISLKGVGVGAAAAAAAIGAVVGKSVQAYADYEQLTGGVETLFGAGGRSINEYAASVGKTVSEVQGEYNKLTAAQDAVMSNAREAYKTAGMSANEYMDTVTGFSASLISSVGGDTVKAADLANQALIDMSDNANKMGTDMESIKNAYQGFAKQNYTMLDNLKLGYGGTQEEMQRLLNDAQKLTGQKYDISSFADVTEAIHAIQTEMDITGTTAKEAEHTISGSLNAMKGAWSNVLADLVNGGSNLDNSINALVETATAFGRNIIPAIESALSGVGKLIEGLAPVIGQAIPTLVSTLLPTLVNSAVSLIQSFVNSIVANGPAIAQGLGDAVLMAVDGLAKIVPNLINAAFMLIQNLSSGLIQAAPQLVNAAVGLLDSLANGLVTNLPVLITSALQLIMALSQGLLNNLPTLVNTAITLVVGFVRGITAMFSQIIAMGIQLVVQLAVGLIQAIPQLIAAIPQIISAIWDGITSVNWLDLGVQIVKGIWDGIKSLAGSVWSGIKSLFTGGGDSGEIDAAAANAGSSYTTTLNNSINSTSIDTTGLSSGLNMDLTAQGTSSAASWSSSFTTSMNGEGAGLATATQTVSSGLSMDLTQQGTQSATSWSNSFSASMSGEGSNLAATTEQIKTAMNLDLTMEGTQSAATWGTGFTTGITDATAAVTTAMEGVKAVVGVDLSAQASAACSGVSVAVSSMCATITSVTQTASKTVIATTKSCGSAVIASITSTMSRFNSTVSAGMNRAVSTVKSGAGGIKSALSDLKLSSVGSNMIQGLIDGINKKKDKAVEAAKSLAKAINAEFEKIEDINSPSKVWKNYGAYLVEGLNIGVTGNIPKAEETVNSLAGVYTPETDESVTTNNSNVTETTTYNPQFNLTINGSNDDRAMERKIKKWILEALAEADEAMLRKQRTVQAF
ncbi:MAG: hypothetical protein Q4G33_03965 [bacterium]|nr:hypothetical protein [bacterium]